jgi:hypothetical protein
MKRVWLGLAICSALGCAQEVPTASDLATAYVKALGGAGKLQGVNTKVMTGTLTNTDDGSTSRMTVKAKAPNRYAIVVALSEDESLQTVFAGDAGWTVDPDSGVRAMNKADVALATSDYDFYRPLHLTDLYPEMSTPRKATLGSATAWVIEAKPVVGEPEKLWFDAATGLLIAREYQRMTLEDGIVAYQERFEDYKPVDGIQVPFKVRRATPDYELIYSFESVQFNAPVEDSAFAKPTLPSGR